MKAVTLKPFRRSMPTSPPCVHLGAEVRIGTQRTYRTCKAGHGSTKEDQRKGLVATCGGCGLPPGVWRLGQQCGPKCGGYQTGGTAVAESKYRWRPTDPPKITRTSERLVITVATGGEGTALHELTGPGQRRYAERVGADYVAITDTTQTWPLLEKFRYREFVAAYPGGTLCLDADVFVTRAAPDLFDLVPPDRLGVSVNADFPVEPKRQALFASKLDAVCRSQGLPIPAGADETHWNSGLVVLRPGMADYWTPPERSLPGDWIDEELWSKVTTFRRGWPVVDIPLVTHWQHWCDRDGLTLRPGVGFLHPAGMGHTPAGKRDRLLLFRILSACGV